MYCLLQGFQSWLGGQVGSSWWQCLFPFPSQGVNENPSSALQLLLQAKGDELQFWIVYTFKGHLTNFPQGTQNVLSHQDHVS